MAEETESPAARDEPSTDDETRDESPAARDEPAADGSARDESPAVSVEDVTFAYGAGEPAVEDVSLTVGRGEFLGLVGPNGSGKTTLLQLILGLLTPDAGRIELFGEPAAAFDDGQRLGYVSQRATDQVAAMPVTVREVVSMGRFPIAGHRRLDDADRAAVARALRTVGLAELADRRLDRLSGGQVQRAFIGRALAGDADLLALDEPTVGVDAQSCDAFYGLLESLNDEGLTVLLIEHDIGVVTNRADRIACINRTLFHHGDVEGFLESEALADAYGHETTVLGHHHHEH